MLFNQVYSLVILKFHFEHSLLLVSIHAYHLEIQIRLQIIIISHKIMIFIYYILSLDVIRMFVIKQIVNILEFLSTANAFQACYLQ